MKLCHSDLFIVRASGGKTCEPTPHHYNEVREMEIFLAEEIASGPKSPGRSEQKWLRRECFRRDNSRCVITGGLDREHSQPWKLMNIMCLQIAPTLYHCHLGSLARKRP